MSVVTAGRRLLMCAAIACAVPFGAIVAQSGSITGKVTDSVNAMGIANATVMAVGATGTVAGTARTSDDGTYRITNLASGTYTVEVRGIGHGQKNVLGVVVGGQPVTVDIAMATVNMLNQVVVTSSRGAAAEKVLDAVGSISVVGEAAIAARPSLTSTDHLKSTPGVDISQGGIVQSNVVARGFNNIFSGALLSLQDYRFAGVPSLRVNVPFLATATNDDIERIEVLLGPASALYGPNSGNGVLHVLTKSPFTSLGTTVTLDGGSQSILRASMRHAALLGNSIGVKVSGEYMHGVDFEYRDPGEPTTFPSAAPPGRAGTPNNRNFDVERYAAEARLDWRGANGAEAVTTVGMSKLVSGIELTGANGAAQAKNWNSTSLQQRYRRGRFFAQAFVNLNNAGNDDSLDLDGTYLLRSGQAIVDKSRVWAVQAQHGLMLGKSNWTYGVDYVDTHPVTENTINGRNEDIDDVTEWGAYTQGTLPLATMWDVMGAFRVDRHSQIDGYQYSPRAALIFKPSVSQNFRVTYNRAFQTPANFTYFVDLISSRNLGGSGFDLRVVGNHSGQTFDRSCAGAGFGDFCMRSIYTGGASTPASAGATMGGIFTANQTAITASITAALASSLGTSAGPVAAAIVNGLKLAQPTTAQLGTRAGFVSSLGTYIDPSDVEDIGPLKAGYNSTYEFGYKGLIGSKGRLSADVWFQQRGEVNPPAFLATPSVFFGTNFAEYLTTNITATITPMLAPGVPAALIAQIAAGVASSLATSALAGAPLGTVTFSDQTRSDLLATYTSVSGETLDVWGIDIGYDWMLADDWTIAGTVSHMNKNVFDEFQGGNGLPYMANSPKNKQTLALRYNNDRSGVGAEVRVRHAEGYPVNSGLYYSGKDIPGPNGPYQYDPVETMTTYDVGFTWRVPFLNNGLTWSLNATNISDEKKPTMAGIPAVGRLIMTRLSYKF